MFLLVLLFLLVFFLFFYNNNEKLREKKEDFSNFEIQNLNCSALSQFTLIPNIGMKNETSMYDPYIEMKPELFEKFLKLFCDSLKETNFTKENVKTKLTSLFQKWFESEDKKVNFQSEKYKILLIGNFREINKFHFGNNYCFDVNTKIDGKILMFRPKSYFNYIVHWKFNDENKVKEAKVVGIVRQEDLINTPSKMTYREFVPNSSKTFSNIPSKKETSLILKNRTEKKKMLNNIYFNEKQFDADKEQGFMCYDQYNLTSKRKCESGINRILERKSRGVWDKTCEINSDCPFYRENKNYKNNRGGCINGFCEMPVNAKQLSPSRRERNDLENLFCHNCDIENGDDQNKCCESQKNKKFPSYGLLASPDYAFLNDYIQREQDKEQLFERNLKLN